MVEYQQRFQKVLFQIFLYQKDTNKRIFLKIRLETTNDVMNNAPRSMYIRWANNLSFAVIPKL